MIPEGEAVLFVVTLKRQAGADMYAGLSGRIESAEDPSLRCPSIDDAGQSWRQLGPAMQKAQAKWYREGRFPPSRMVIHQLRTHIVDSSVRTFQYALSGLFQAMQGQPGILRAGELQHRSAPMLPDQIQALSDAGHFAQAVELLAALDDTQALRRLLQEIAFTHPDAHFFDALFSLDADRAAAVLTAQVAAEQAGLRESLRLPATQEWQKRGRREALKKLAAPLPCDREHATETLKLLIHAGFQARRGRGYGVVLKEALLESVLPR